MTDPIADLLTRIRNGITARHESVTVPASKIKEDILKLFKKEGFIEGYVREEQKPQDQLKVILKYENGMNSVIHEIGRVSRPGRRIYKGYSEIKPLLSGMGLTVVSTPKGIISDKDARQSKVGGELLCYVW